MAKCDCYFQHGTKFLCYGTKEMEECSCGGDESKCNFYPEKRKPKMANEKRLIDVNALKARFKLRIDWLARDAHDEYTTGLFHGAETDVELIDEIPTVDAEEVVHGRWRQKILVGGFAEEWGYVCSECGCTVSDRSNLGIGRYASKNQRLNYCPNCGVKMDGDGNG